MTFTALILAGSRPGEDPTAVCAGVAHKALIELGGETLLDKVVHAVRGAGADRVLVSCSLAVVAEHARALGCEVLQAQEGPSASVAAAFDLAGPALLVTTADHAFLRAQWVSELVTGCAPDADLALMLAERSKVEEAMPGSRRTYLRFADGQWSGCNLFYLRTADARRAVELWQSIERDRKKPWKIALRVGIGTLLTYLRGKLPIQSALDRLGAMIGISVTLVPASDGLAAVDIDKPQDLEDARRLVG